MTRRLAREEGLLVGISRRRERWWRATVACAGRRRRPWSSTILCDGGERYLSERFWDEPAEAP